MKSLALLSTLLLWQSITNAANGSGGPTVPPGPPTVSETSPLNNALTAPTNSLIYIAFNKGLTVVPTAAMLTLTDSSGNVIKTTAAGAQNSVVYTPATTLIAGMKYSVAFSDTTDATTYSWSFTTAQTADTTAPAIKSSVPATNAKLVDATMNLSVIFSKVMDPATLTNANVKVTTSDNKPVSGTLDYNYDTRNLNFTPDDTFGYGLGVTVAFTNTTDMEGNALASPTITFTTGASGSQSWSSAGSYSFTVPDGITQITVNTGGGGGGAGSGCNGWTGGDGGSGGTSGGTLAVTDGESITVNVGGLGASGSYGDGGQGGGDSWITTNIGTQSTSYFDAGGGGGGQGSGLQGGSAGDCTYGGSGGQDGYVSIGWN